MADLYERLKRFKHGTTQESAEKKTVPEPAKGGASIPESLLNVPGISRGRDLLDSIQKRDEAKFAFIASLGFETVTNKPGSCVVRDVFYPSNELLYPPEEITAKELALQTRDERFTGIHPKEILFLDTETTSLAGGTGTVPFLTGVGYFERGGFLVRQFLMRDYDEEPSLLHEFENTLSRFKAISTYNGKTFDVPILTTRYMLNRLRTRMTQLPHADLLFPARRLWRDFLPDCSLGTLESSILGRVREDDIPGALIPYVYFDFLRGIRIERMRPVLNHNADDILSLAFVAARTCQMLREPLDDSLHGQEIAAMGRIFVIENDWERACVCFERALERNDLPELIRLKTEKHLSILYKRMERYDRARSLWLKRIESGSTDLFAYIELAKLYEHKDRLPALALEVTEKALDIARLATEGKKLVEALNHRRGRLMRKLEIGDRV